MESSSEVDDKKSYVMYAPCTGQLPVLMLQYMHTFSLVRQATSLKAEREKYTWLVRLG